MDKKNRKWEKKWEKWLPIAAQIFSQFFLLFQYFSSLDHVNVGDVIRQLKLYREYQKGTRLVLATTSPITEQQHQALKSEGITVVELGDDFQSWKQSVASSQSSKLFSL